MKKTFLLIMALLTATTCANAVNWQTVETNIPNFNLYIDQDSISNINANECVYAIRFQSGNKPEQVAYLKSNSSNNYIGVINAGDFEESSYKPKAVFYNAHVFMKPVNGDSFLNFAHTYAINTVADRALAKARSNNEFEQSAFSTASNYSNSNVRNVAYTVKLPSQRQSSATNLGEYVAETANLINANWTPPQSGRNTQAILITQIGADGSLQNYKFAKPSGDIATDRSIISAVEKTIPFARFPKMAGDADTLNFQFVFDHKLIRKSVM